MATNKKTRTRTINHDEIKQWAEDRGGRPSVATSPRSAGFLAIDFGEGGAVLEQVSWDEFFRMFEENDFAFVYEAESGDGETTYFYQFVARGPEDEMAEMDEGALLEDDSM